MTAWRDLNSVWFERHTGYRDAPEPPEFYTEEIRRVTDIDGVLLVVFRDQDGETWVMDAEDYDWKGPRP